MPENPRQQTIGNIFYKSEYVNSIKEKLTEEEFGTFTDFVKTSILAKGTNEYEPAMVDVFNFLKKLVAIQNMQDQEYDELLLGITYLMEDIGRTPIESTEEDEDVVITLPTNATFAELHEAIDNLTERDRENFYIEEALIDDFDTDIETKFMDFRFNQEAAASTTVLGFFEEENYSQEYVETYLPLVFK